MQELLKQKYKGPEYPWLLLKKPLQKHKNKLQMESSSQADL